MASGLSPIKIGMPKMPPIPYEGKMSFFKWVAQLYVELELYFGKMRDQLVDNRGFLQVDSQVVEAGFSVIPSANYVDITSMSAVTSDTVAAIAVGVEGQALILTNTGGFNITLKHGAQTFLIGGVDQVIEPLHSIFLRWDNVTPVWTQVRVS